VSGLFTLHLSDLLTVKVSIFDVFIRGTLLYAGLCLLLRIIPKRQIGKSSLTDLLFVILIGSFAADAISKDAESVGDYFVVMVPVMLLAYAFDFLAYRYRWFRRLMLEPPTCLVKDGRILKANLRREMISEDDLMRERRRQDVHDADEVEEAHLEADGEISILARRQVDKGRPTSSPREQRAGGRRRPPLPSSPRRDARVSRYGVTATFNTPSR